MSGSRSYSHSTIKRLFARSGNLCAFPGCEIELSSEHNSANSNICHIEAISPSGPRYNPEMTDKERNDYPNLIVLCPNHHARVDSDLSYTVEDLTQMKADHEQMVKERLQDSRSLTKRPSLLAALIQQIAALEFGIEPPRQPIRPPKIDEKIEYNGLVKFRPIIEAHSVYASELSAIYDEFYRVGDSTPQKVLRAVNGVYLLKKGALLRGDLSIENVRSHADELIEGVQDELLERLELSPNMDSELPFEDVDFALSIILVDAFIRCKILEAPP